MSIFECYHCGGKRLRSAGAGIWQCVECGAITDTRKGTPICVHGTQYQSPDQIVDTLAACLGFFREIGVEYQEMPL